MIPRAASRTSLLRACWSVPRRDVKVLASALKNGTLLSGSSVPGAKPESIYKVVDKQHNKPGKGGAYIIAKMVDVHSGSQTNARWSSSDKVETVEPEAAVAATYLYEAGGELFFMDMGTFDEIPVDAKVVAAQLPWLQDGMEVKLRMMSGKALSVVLPKTGVYEVAETEPAGKSQRTHTNKPAVLSNGAQIKVPLFVEVGDRIVVNTKSVDDDDFGTYVSREPGAHKQ